MIPFVFYFQSEIHIYQIHIRAIMIELVFYFQFEMHISHIEH
jgi:hypothetical protein